MMFHVRHGIPRMEYDVHEWCTTLVRADAERRIPWYQSNLGNAQHTYIAGSANAELSIDSGATISLSGGTQRTTLPPKKKRDVQQSFLLDVR
jgi:hypothetical protein